MSLKQSFNLKMSQQLAMTPQLQQAIRLLQLSTLDLQTELLTQVESNPMLDLEEESLSSENWPEHPGSFASPTASTGHSSRIADPDSDPMAQRAESETLAQHLTAQILLLPLSDLDRQIAMTIIDSIDEQGYFRTPLPELAASLKPELDLTEADILPVLHLIQHLDPPGIAAQNLQDCLLLQLNALPQSTPTVELAKTIISDHLQLCADHQYIKLLKLLHVNETQLREALRLIQSLNPRPGSQISTLNTTYVIPDVLVKKRQGRWVVELNPATLPRIKINAEYASWVKRAQSPRDHSFLKEQLQEARWLMKSLQSRNETLLRVAQCIVDHQVGFFEKGDEALKPMVLQHVASDLDLHESTISRITTQKYLYSPRGIYELKYFFSSHVSTEDGGECSSKAIRSFIKKLINSENAEKPLSDHQIAQLLDQEGIRIARRTIAKYRDQLRIPSSNERKKLKWVEQI